jgi:hypothetical protein
MKIIITIFFLYLYVIKLLFKLKLTYDPTCERCLEEEELATHILCDCEAIAHLRNSSWNQVTTMMPP